MHPCPPSFLCVDRLSLTAWLTMGTAATGLGITAKKLFIFYIFIRLIILYPIVFQYLPLWVCRLENQRLMVAFYLTDTTVALYWMRDRHSSCFLSVGGSRDHRMPVPLAKPRSTAHLLVCFPAPCTLPDPQQQQQSTYGNAWFDIVSFYFAEMSICMFSSSLQPATTTTVTQGVWNAIQGYCQCC